MSKPRAGLLTAISVARIVPRRWHDLYYSVLERLGYETLPTEDQVIADGIAYSYVEFAEARESMRDNDIREKPDFAAIQKRLLGWLGAWRESRKKPAMEQQQELIGELGKYATGYGVEDID